MAEKIEEKIQKLIEKVEKSKKEKLDLSSDEDLSVAIMNLISIEEHFFFSGAKTGNDKYFDLLNQTRQMRKELLAKLVKDVEPGSEVWCLPGETVIYANPAPKKINQIEREEMVLGINGKFSKTRLTFEREYKGEMIKIIPYYGDELLITPEHLVLCATDVRKKQKNVWRKNLKEPKIVWKKAKDLQDTDFLLFPRYKKTKDVKEIELKYSWRNGKRTFTQTLKVKVDENLLKLIGLYLAEGSVHQSEYYWKGQRKTRANLYFSFGKNESRLIEETKRLFKEVFNEELKEVETHTNIDLRSSKRVLVKFFKQFGNSASSKEIPLWILDLPNDKLFHLIWGLFKGDGCENKYVLSYFTTSEKLAYQLRLLLFKVGIIHSLKKRKMNISEIEGRKIIPSNPHGFTIAISGDAARILKNKIGLRYSCKKTSGNFGYVLKDYVMIPIRKIEKVKYSGKVYNLHTDSETYTTFTGVVHNCISKHLLAASMRLIEVGTKYYQDGKKEEAKDLFEKAYQLWSLFFALNLKLVDIGEVKKIDEKQLNVHDKEKKGFFGKLGEIIKKIVDCCIE